MLSLSSQFRPGFAPVPTQQYKDFSNYLMNRWLNRWLNTGVHLLKINSLFYTHRKRIVNLKLPVSINKSVPILKANNLAGKSFDLMCMPAPVVPESHSWNRSFTLQTLLLNPKLIDSDGTDRWWEKTTIVHKFILGANMRGRSQTLCNLDTPQNLIFFLDFQKQHKTWM